MSNSFLLFLLEIWALFSSLKAETWKSCAKTVIEGVTFDLTPLRLTSGNQLKYYSILDTSQLDNNSSYFTYYLNICNEVLHSPPGSTGCKIAQKCIDSSNDCSSIDNLEPIFSSG